MSKKVNPDLEQVVKKLSEGQHYTLTALNQSLGLSVEYLTQLVRELREYQLPIEVSQETGLALLGPVILLNETLITKTLPSTIAFELFASINSTNEYLKKLPAISKIHVCLAEQQTHGRGRFQREWHSPFAENIYLSCAIPFMQSNATLGGLSIVSAIAIIKTLQILQLPEELTIKWPNDILYAGKKLAGILIEVRPQDNQLSCCIVGVGLNINMLFDKSGSITKPYTSLRKILGCYVDRNPICALLIENLLQQIELFKTKGLSFFLKRWQSLDYLSQKSVTLQMAEKTITGRACGINELGHLCLQLPDGQIHYFSSGEVTIIS